MLKALKFVGLTLYAAVFVEAYTWYAVDDIRKGPSFTVYDAEHGLAMRKNFAGRRVTHEYDMSFTTGEQGFRGGTYDVVKPSGTLRVASVGNSQAFGVGVDDDETYCQLAERELNERVDCDVQVMNMAVTESKTDTVLSMWDKIVSFEPHVLLVRYDYWNFINPNLIYKVRDGQLVHRETFPNTGLRRRLEKVALLRHFEGFAWYGFVRLKLPTYLTRMREARDRMFTLHTQTPEAEKPPISYDWKEFLQLKELLYRAEAAQLDVVFLKFPLYPHDVSDHFRSVNPNRDERFAALVDRDGVVVIDCSDLDMGRRPELYYPEDEHLNLLGHAELARRVSDGLTGQLSSDCQGSGSK